MQFWIEKTYVKSRPDRQQGDFAFGSVTSNNTDRATIAQIIDTDTCEMMLLYPTVDSPLSHDFMDGLHRIKIRTINLEQNWQGIHKDLLALVA